MTSDEELAREMQKGQPAAMEALVHRYHRAVFAYLFRMTRQWQTAEDLTQECFLRLLTGIGSYRYPRPFRPWLYAIATNVCRDYHKQAYTRRVELQPGVDQAAAAAPSGEPANVIEVNETRIVLLRAMAGLTEAQREIVILHLYQDLTLAEASEALGIPLGTAKSRLAAALVGLRRQLAAEGLFPEVDRIGWSRLDSAGREGQR